MPPMNLAAIVDRWWAVIAKLCQNALTTHGFYF
jgi:hypothetical protein